MQERAPAATADESGIEMTRAIERRDQPQGLTLDLVVQMTGFQPAQIALISKTVAQGAPLQELAMFLHACHELRLDPLLRQAYWIRRKGREQVNGQWVDVYKGTLQVGIDGFRALADRQGNYAGSEPPTFSDWTTIVTDKHETIDVPGRAQVRIWKIVQGRSCCFTGEANWTEFYPGAGPNGQMWRKMPKHQLAKCAEAQALRKGWPAVLGSMAMDAGIGDEIETGPIGVPVTTVTEQPPARPRPVPAATDYDRTIGAEYDAQDRGWEPAPVESAPEPTVDVEIVKGVRHPVNQELAGLLEAVAAGGGDIEPLKITLPAPITAVREKIAQAQRVIDELTPAEPQQAF